MMMMMMMIFVMLPRFRCFRRTDVTDLKATSNVTETEEEESTLPLDWSSCWIAGGLQKGWHAWDFWRSDIFGHIFEGFLIERDEICGVRFVGFGLAKVRYPGLCAKHWKHLFWHWESFPVSRATDIHEKDRKGGSRLSGCPCCLDGWFQVPKSPSAFAVIKCWKLCSFCRQRLFFGASNAVFPQLNFLGLLIHFSVLNLPQRVQWYLKQLGLSAGAACRKIFVQIFKQNPDPQTSGFKNHQTQNHKPFGDLWEYG